MMKESTITLCVRKPIDRHNLLARSCVYLVSCYGRRQKNLLRCNLFPIATVKPHDNNMNPLDSMSSLGGSKSSAHYFATSILTSSTKSMPSFSSSTTASMSNLSFTSENHLGEEDKLNLHFGHYSNKFIFGQLLGLVVGIGLGSGIVLFYWGLADADTIMRAAQSMTFRVLESILAMSFFTAFTIAIFEMTSFGESGSIIGSKIGKYSSPTVCITVVDCATKLTHFFSDLALATTLTCNSLTHDPTAAVAASNSDPQESKAPNKSHGDGY